MLAPPDVSDPEISLARETLATHPLDPSLNLRDYEMDSRLQYLWRDTRPAIYRVCTRVFGGGCAQEIDRMTVIVVPDESVNAYADGSTYTIGMHAGLLRSAGSDDEIVAVLAHEAGHLLLDHTEKKFANAANAGIASAVVGFILGVAAETDNTPPSVKWDTAIQAGNAGFTIGYLAYSPEMEIEADQFAMFVLRESGRRLTAATDLIVRLHRGDVPDPVRAGEGWAGYLQTHPSNDLRIAAMRSTIDDITRYGLDRPLREGQTLVVIDYEEGVLDTERLRAEEGPGVCAERFRTRWPNCSDFRGVESSGLSWQLNCPDDVPEDSPQLWQSCSAWYLDCHRDPQTCAE